MEITYDMQDHIYAFGEDSRFVMAADPDSEPDPEFAGMFFAEIDEELYEIEREERLAYDDWAYANRSWFADHRISHG